MVGSWEGAANSTTPPSNRRRRRCSRIPRTRLPTVAVGVDAGCRISGPGDGDRTHRVILASGDSQEAAVVIGMNRQTIVPVDRSRVGHPVARDVAHVRLISETATEEKSDDAHVSEVANVLPVLRQQKVLAVVVLIMAGGVVAGAVDRVAQGNLPDHSLSIRGGKNRVDELAQSLEVSRVPPRVV